MSFSRDFPEAYRTLREVGDRLEAKLRDACDLEFVIENGTLYVSTFRPAKRTPIAGIRIALELVCESKISPAEALERIEPTDIEAFLAGEIANRDDLREIGRGLPASVGAASGRLLLSGHRSSEDRALAKPFILLKEDLVPEDILSIEAAAGVVTLRGGLTSHAAVVCRGLGVPCVVGCGGVTLLGSGEEIWTSTGDSHTAGEWITLDGTTGLVFSGRAKISSRPWQTRAELRGLAALTDALIRSGAVPPTALGKAWRIRDFFAHRRPLATHTLSGKKPVIRERYKAFRPPAEAVLEAARAELQPVPSGQRSNYSEILIGFSESLGRCLTASLGLGNHHRYFRPLWDPLTQITEVKGGLRRQFIGFEFFGVNRYVAHLIDVSSVLFLLWIDLGYEPGSEWFLDFTNPSGENLVPGADAVSFCSVFINNARVANCDLPHLYDVIRRREYYWRWFEHNRTSYEEISSFLALPEIRRPRGVLNLLCEELGLVQAGQLTLSGRCLVDNEGSGGEYVFQYPRGLAYPGQATPGLHHRQGD